MLPVLRFFLWVGLAFIAFCVFLGAVSAGNNRQQVNANILWGLFFVSVIILVWLRNWVLTGSSKKEVQARMNVLEEFQRQHNFKADKALAGSVVILFDTQAGRMAFYENDVITEYPLDYIRSWEQRWTYRGDKTYDHKFEVRLNDLNRPRVTITPGAGWSAGSRENADHWEATLDLILNRPNPT